MVMKNSMESYGESSAKEQEHKLHAGPIFLAYVWFRALHFISQDDAGNELAAGNLGALDVLHTCCETAHRQHNSA